MSEDEARDYIEKRLASVAPAPQWLKERMDALAATPPPTIEQVRAQFKASMEARNRSGSSSS